MLHLVGGNFFIYIFGFIRFFTYLCIQVDIASISQTYCTFSRWEGIHRFFLTYSQHGRIRGTISRAQVIVSTELKVL